ncbi:MAG: DUF998 domain-containing protein [Halanaeroarchaeum sp.]
MGDASSPGIESNTGVPNAAESGLDRAHRIAGLSFFVLAAQFVVVLVLGAAMVPGYDFDAAAISDLGVAPETALLFNGSLVLVGLLNLVGGWAYYRIHGSRILFGTFVVASLGGAGAAVFTLGAAPGVHGLFALLAFLFFNLEAIGSGGRSTGPMRVLAVGLGVLGLAFVMVMAIGDAGNATVFGAIGHGGTERMIVYPPMLWLLAFGGYLLGGETGQAGSADATTPRDGSESATGGSG